eukprot:TRINITY_DN100816_c0_g1_i1.p1 TRINITY_DN100816_c0_g1~~TRINITY_DN100816_c0_g1_i1.p1  ORF type:complete len:642 (-),score=129.07 TRINITY_DN100816_c0_g1_i1:77-2002(-)
MASLHPCLARPTPADVWACVSPDLTLVAEEARLRASPHSSRHLEAPWLKPLLYLADGARARRQAKRAAFAAPAGSGLKVAILSGIPEHFAGPSARFVSACNGSGPISAASAHRPLKWRRVARSGGVEEALAATAENIDKKFLKSVCSAETGPYLGCLGFDNVGYIQMFEADLIHWRYLEPPKAKDIRLLAQYDVLVYFEFERRLLPDLPRIPGQLRLWFGSETWGYGDVNNVQHRAFNHFRPDRLARRGFCPVALDPYLIGNQAQGPTFPFWYRYPLQEIEDAMLRRGIKKSQRRSRRIFMIAATKADGFVRALQSMGFEVVQQFEVDYYVFLKLLASCRFLIYLPTWNGRSQGRTTVPAALLGVPVFGRREKHLQRLLMPSFLAVDSLEDILTKVQYLDQNEAAETVLRAEILRRRKLLDARGAPEAAEVADAVRLISGGNPLCSLNKTARASFAAAASDRFSSNVEAVLDATSGVDTAASYYEQWMNESLGEHLAMHSQQLRCEEWERDPKDVPCYGGSVEVAARNVAGASACLVQRWQPTPQLYAILAFCAYRLWVPSAFDLQLARRLAEVSADAIQKWMQHDETTTGWAKRGPFLEYRSKVLAQLRDAERNRKRPSSLAWLGLAHLDTEGCISHTSV